MLTHFHPLHGSLHRSPSISAARAFKHESPPCFSRMKGQRVFLDTALAGICEKTQTMLSSIFLLWNPRSQRGQTQRDEGQPGTKQTAVFLAVSHSLFQAIFPLGKALERNVQCVSVFKSELSTNFFDGSISYAYFDLAFEGKAVPYRNHMTAIMELLLLWFFRPRKGPVGHGQNASHNTQTTFSHLGCLTDMKM